MKTKKGGVEGVGQKYRLKTIKGGVDPKERLLSLVLARKDVPSDVRKYVLEYNTPPQPINNTNIDRLVGEYLMDEIQIQIHLQVHI